MSKTYTLYKIYYDDNLVYLGRTKQPLQDRIRGHLFKKPMHKVIDINLVSKIEYAEFKTEADMYLYEIYFINKYKPAFNCDDKAKDKLTVELPDVEFKIFTTPLWGKWQNEIKKKDEDYRKNIEERAKQEENWRKKKQEAFKKLKEDGITKEEYAKIISDIQKEKMKAKYERGEISFEEYCIEMEYTKLK
jgi:hypothetical protein